MSRRGPGRKTGQDRQELIPCKAGQTLEAPSRHSREEGGQRGHGDGHLCPVGATEGGSLGSRLREGPARPKTVPSTGGGVPKVLVPWGLLRAGCPAGSAGSTWWEVPGASSTWGPHELPPFVPQQSGLGRTTANSLVLVPAARLSREPPEQQRKGLSPGAEQTGWGAPWVSPAPETPSAV